MRGVSESEDKVRRKRQREIQREGDEGRGESGRG